MIIWSKHNIEIHFFGILIKKAPLIRWFHIHIFKFFICIIILFIYIFIHQSKSHHIYSIQWSLFFVLYIPLLYFNIFYDIIGRLFVAKVQASLLLLSEYLDFNKNLLNYLYYDIIFYMNSCVISLQPYGYSFSINKDSFRNNFLLIFFYFLDSKFFFSTFIQLG